MRVFDQAGQEFIDVETLSLGQGVGNLANEPWGKKHGKWWPTLSQVDFLMPSQRVEEGIKRLRKVGLLWGQKASQKIIFYGRSQRIPCAMIVSDFGSSETYKVSIGSSLQTSSEHVMSLGPMGLQRNGGQTTVLNH